MPERINVRASRLVTRPIDGLMGPQELVTSLTGGGSTVPHLNATPMGGDRRVENHPTSTLLQRLHWLIVGPPDIIGGFTGAAQQGAGVTLLERLRWAIFGPQHVWKFAPIERQREAEQLGGDRQRNQSQPYISPYGFVDMARATDGMAVLWADGFGKMPPQIYPSLTPSIKQTDVQPYVYTRTLWPVFDKWWPARYDANTLLGYNPYTGLGLATVGDHIMPGDTVPPLSNSGQGQQFPSPVVRAVLRVPRYSTQPATIVPRSSP